MPRPIENPVTEVSPQPGSKNATRTFPILRVEAISSRQRSKQRSTMRCGHFEKAKTESHGYMTGVVQRAGLDALTTNPPLAIEDKSDAQKSRG